MSFTNQRYEALRDLFKSQRLPLAFIDLDAFDANVETAASLAKQFDKKLRLGTKSLRCLPLMKRVLAHTSSVFQGFLTYTAEETAFLARAGYDDFLLGYPTLQPSDIEILAWIAKQKKQLSVMADSLEHLNTLNEAGKRHHIIFHVCIEVDMAYRPFSKDILHLGLRRSPLRTAEDVMKLVHSAKKLKNIKIDSLMGYEGHIAGTNDNYPNQALKNYFLRRLKHASVKELTSRREAIIRHVKDAGIELRIVNGGGSGSLFSTLKDASVTEATIGSGLYASALFHHFKEIKFEPAAFFALQIVRKPKENMITCAGGGYVASGAVGTNKLPLPVLPLGLQYVKLEGAGETQTPLTLRPNSPKLNIGDPVFFQHAKAGELCERFNELFLLQGGRIIDCVKTYRGEGFAFL